MKICFNPAFVLCMFAFLTKVTHTQGNPMCYKRLPEISSDNCCCPLPNFYTEGIKTKCNSTDDHFKLDTEKKHLCFVACAFDEIGIFNQNAYQKEIFQSYLNEAMPDSKHIQDDMQNYIEKCIDNFAQLGELIPKRGYCALYPNLVMDCIFIKTFKNCPTSIWSNSDDCNTIRDHWRQCLPDELEIYID